MGSWTAFLLTYLFGGLTFLPLLVIAVLVHAHLTFPTRNDVAPSPHDDKDAIVLPGDDTSALEAVKKDGVKSTSSSHLDPASGYFAVCREYTPMGINAKPIERSTPLGSATVAAPSPSVYQTMYRSIFERKGPAAAATAGTAGTANTGGAGENSSMSQRPKNAGNVFYVVLRHGHLMLFDDEEQIEVRHVISLAHHNISVYSGGDVTPEGELWIKRNAICLSWKTDEAGSLDGQASKPFYLFTENCSAKEDFYFALLKNKEQTFTAKQDTAPAPKSFDVRHMISLVERLHASEDNVHSRWLNALIGRMFLGVHRTADIENYIRDKITKKIARVKRPSFLTNITIRKIDTGEAAPFFTNLKLRELTVDGDCVVEADVKYNGNFRLEVAATVKIDLGPRFKAREVNIVLAVVAKRIEGHGLLKIKPPPSNRAWIAFQTRPKMELTIEPIVSARQITYTVILRQIENRIKEVVAETLVLPFWDDIPFFKTEHKEWRGGIFEGDDAVVSDYKNSEDVVAQTGDVDALERMEEKPELLAEVRSLEKTTTSTSLPEKLEKPDKSERPEKPDKPDKPDKPEREPGAMSMIFGKKSRTADASPASSSISLETSKLPGASGLRSPQIISSPREPVVGTDSTNADVFHPSTSPPDYATSFVAALHSRSHGGSPATAPHDASGLGDHPPSLSLTSETGGEGEKPAEDDSAPSTPSLWARRNTTSSAEGEPTGDVPDSPVSTKSTSKYSTASLGRNFWLRRENSTASTATGSTSSELPNLGQKTNNTLAAVSNAALQARQWGWNAIQRQKEARKNSSSEAPSQPVDLTQPMGRGQPLPPPGTPLPMPTNGTTKIAPREIPKRKDLPPKQGSGSSSTVDSGEEQASAPAAPPRRRRGASHDGPPDEVDEPPGMLVIAAPDDSQPGTPAAVDDDDELEFRWDRGVETTASAPSTVDPTDDDDDASSRHMVHMSHTTQPSTQSDAAPETEPERKMSQPPVEDAVKGAEKQPTVMPTWPAPVSVAASAPAKRPGLVEDDDDFSGWMDDADVETSDVEDKNGEDKGGATPITNVAK